MLKMDLNQRNKLQKEGCIVLKARFLLSLLIIKSEKI